MNCTRYLLVALSHEWSVLCGCQLASALGTELLTVTFRCVQEITGSLGILLSSSDYLPTAAIILTWLICNSYNVIYCV